MERASRIAVAALVVWQVSVLTLLNLAGAEDRIAGAMARMATGVSVLWIGGCGVLSLWGRDAIRRLTRHAPLPPPLTFIVLATLLALAEEAVATLMTNCAPLFGVRVGEAYVTASANYVDVVLFHSVVIFLPQFAAWAWLLGRYDFSPFAVFVLFGFTGWLNETLFAGPQFLALPQWILIYGLMAYLPAYSYPDTPGRTRVRWWHYPVAVSLPVLAAMPLVALLVRVIAPGHPRIHFPPLGGP